MDINLSDEQQMLVDSAREFLRDHCPLSAVRQWEQLPLRYPPELWAQLAGMGWARRPCTTGYALPKLTCPE